MRRDESKNLAASVRQRLLNASRQRGEDFGLVLDRYVIERWLFRLSKTLYVERFVLKGALLFMVWTHRAYRPTRDLDLLSFGKPSADWLERVVRQVCRAPVPPDGLAFDPDSVGVTETRPNQEYQGLRATFRANLGAAKISVQIDVGFGDVITPEPAEVTYPTLLASLPAPRVLTYPPETMIAEKLEAMIRLGLPNSRMKDFYDVWWMSREFDFDGGILTRAIRATFGRRRTEVPSAVPLALSSEFAGDALKSKQWNAFRGRYGLAEGTPDLATVIEGLKEFLIPLLAAAASKEDLRKAWPSGGPWSAGRGER